MQNPSHALRLKRLGISTYKEAVIYLRQDSYICKAEGFETPARIQVHYNGKSIIATLNTIATALLHKDEASLSEWAWETLGAKEGDLIYLSHPAPLNSMDCVRAKVRGEKLSSHSFQEIIADIVLGNLSDIQISSFLTACADGCLNHAEIAYLTNAMLGVGDRLKWDKDLVVDKHCIGGLPGNRTTMIVVPIVAQFGLIIPKTSSRAITSAAGTADTMETLAPVELDFNKVRSVVERENGCVVWGDAAKLSPADDLMIRVERVLNLDSQGQMVASVLSKKIAAGSTHALIDVPIGDAMKIKNEKEAAILRTILEEIGGKLGLKVQTVITDGTKPVGRGIGPALEAYDVLAVLQNHKAAPQDLRERALLLAGKILEFSPKVKSGAGFKLAEEILSSGKAWHKFQAICEAQGGMRTPPKAPYTYVHAAPKAGVITKVNNRKITLIAKLAGAPSDKAAGVELHATVKDKIEHGEPLLTVHAESPGELDYAVNFLKQNEDVIYCDQG